MFSILWITNSPFMRPIIRHVTTVLLVVVLARRVSRVHTGRYAVVVALVPRQRWLGAFDRLVLGAVLRYRFRALFVIGVAAVNTSAKGVKIIEDRKVSTGFQLTLNR